MTKHIKAGNLQVADTLYELVNHDIIPGTDINADDFWSALEQCVTQLGPKNQALLQKRDELQSQIDVWHRQHRSC